MKHHYKSCFLVIALLATTAFAQAEKRQQINLQQQEIAEILAAKDTYAYFGPAICSLASDLPALKKMAAAAGIDAQHLRALAEIAAQGYTTAPADMVKAALEEAAACVAACKAQLSAEELARIADALEAYDQAVQSGAADVIVADDEDEEAATRGTKKFDNVVIRKQASIGSLYVGGDTIINHNLTVNGDELVRGNLTVLGETIFSDTSVTFAGDQIITGNLKVLENIKLPDANAAGTVGVLQLGVDPIYEFNMGTSNFFAGDYTAGMPNPATLTGANNISIGTQANSTLTISSQNISIGSNSRAGSPTSTGVNNCIALGLNATATGNVSTAIGSSASAKGETSVAIGIVAQANGAGSIAFGGSSQANASFSTALGSSSAASATYATALGSFAVASNSNSIAIGGGLSGVTNGATASGLNAIAIGSYDATNVISPALASNTRSIAIGTGAVASGISSLALGDATNATGLNSISMGTGTASAANGIAIGEGVTVLGDHGVAIGTNAMGTGINTVAIGVNANNLGAPSGISSIAIGNSAQAINSFAIAMGISANASGGNSIALGSNVTTTADSQIRIGTGGGYTSFFIPESTFGATIVGGNPLLVDAIGHVGGVVSSKRFKENFRSLDAHSAQIYKLNPVKFDYKIEHGGGKDQFGLLAEDVAQHIPEIVTRDAQGEIHTVQYHVLPTLLLNEMKHHQRKFESQDEAIAQLLARVAVLEAAAQKSR